MGLILSKWESGTAERRRWRPGLIRSLFIRLRFKKIQVLLNVDLFDEGLDVPGIECVIMARPTKSLGKYLQMVGRGLRIAEGKPHLILIDHVGNVTDPMLGLPDDIRTCNVMY